MYNHHKRWTRPRLMQALPSGGKCCPYCIRDMLLSVIDSIFFLYVTEFILRYSPESAVKPA